MADFNEPAVNQLIASDPQIQALLRQARQDPGMRGGASANRTGYQQVMARYEPQIAARLQELGVQLPQGYGVNLLDGTLGHDNWFFRNAPWLVPAALGGAAGITALAGAAGSAPSAAAGGGYGAGFVGPTIEQAGGSALAGGAGAAGLAGPIAGLPEYDAMGNAIVGPTVAQAGAQTASRVSQANGGTAADVANAANAAGTGNSLANILKKLALGLAPVGGALAGRALAGSPPQPPQIPDELKQLLALSMKRMADQQPLADRVNAGELAGLPRLT